MITVWIACWWIAGCVGLAGVEPTDLSALRIGIDSQHVNSILGDPVETERRDDGRIDTYAYNRGNRPIMIEAGRCVGMGCAGHVLVEALMLTPAPHAYWYAEQRGRIRVAYGADDKVIGFPADGLSEDDLQTARFLEFQNRITSPATLDVSVCGPMHELDCELEVAGSLRQSDRIDRILIEPGTQRVVFRGSGGKSSGGRTGYKTADVTFEPNHAYRLDFTDSWWVCGAFNYGWRAQIKDEATGEIKALVNYDCPE
jgi:hypothetical protein